MQSSRMSCPPGPFIARPRLTPGGCLRALGPAVAVGSETGAGFDSSSEGVFRKILSPHTVGVDPLQAGIFVFHLMFFSLLHVSGKFFASGAVPSPFGPRQFGQLAAAGAWLAITANITRKLRATHKRGGFGV